MNFNAIILAAGKGTRMKSDLPKCVFPFFGKPMITYIINSCHKAGIEDICVVVGHKKEEIMKILNCRIRLSGRTIRYWTCRSMC